MDALWLCAIGAACALLATVFIQWHATSKDRHLPPGPRALPILGNMLDLTTKELWLCVDQWAREHGEITRLHILGKDVIFLNSAESAFELLDRRGAIYSGKPRLVMVGEMCGCENMVPFTTYGDTFRRRRKLMQLTLGPRNIPDYYSRLEIETKRFVESLVSEPRNYIRHIRRYSGGLTLAVVYGYEASSSDDKFLLLAEESMDLLANHMAPGPGLWPVDIIPALQYLPAWFPGGSFKTKATEWKKKMEEFVERPFIYAKESLKSGTIQPSFCASLLDVESVTPEREADLKWTANSMYAASADTTISTISHLILAMLYHPEAIQKGRDEIRQVIGAGRLPTFADRPSLPFVECILNETWRWGSPVPLNLPHTLERDDSYNGFLIPKDTVVIANHWTMLHDESIYPNPYDFKPERFMEPVTSEMRRKMDPRNIIFGFGRRRCPGADLVDSSIWLLLATMILTVDISKLRDTSGAAVEPDIDFNNLFFRTPKSFEFSVKLVPSLSASLE